MKASDPEHLKLLRIRNGLALACLLSFALAYFGYGEPLVRWLMWTTFVLGFVVQGVLLAAAWVSQGAHDKR